MTTQAKRPYRKKLTSQGFVYIARKELDITVKNLSITGMLAEIRDTASHQDLLSSLSVPLPLDFYLPELHLAGEAQIVRIDTEEQKVTLALEFNHIAYDVNNIMYKRKAHRKNLSVPGEITLNGYTHDFVSINVSLDGLMVRIKPIPCPIPEGTIAQFKFKQLNMQGRVKVIWTDTGDNEGTVIGLQYVNVKKEEPQNTSLKNA